jgi:hypothetical protein
MADIAYLIHTEIRKRLGAHAEESMTWLVLPPPEFKSGEPDASAYVFVVLVEAVRETSRHPVIEEIWQRRIFVDDLRPYRNAYVHEKDGWRCMRVT